MKTGRICILLSKKSNKEQGDVAVSASQVILVAGARPRQRADGRSSRRCAVPSVAADGLYGTGQGQASCLRLT